MATTQRRDGAARHSTPSSRDVLAARLADWKARASRQPGGAVARQTYSGFPIAGVYTPLDLDGLDYLRDVGLPGEFPFTRGVHHTGYRGKPWTMRIFAGFGTAEDTNARFKYLLAHGETGLSVAFDLPTLYGYDTDHPLAAGKAYVEAALERGLAIDDFAPRLSFFFNAHNTFFEEIAKYRAARRIWARLLRERYGAKNERSLWLRFHTQTAGVTCTAQQPENNVVRIALQALAAVLGGTQSLHTNSLDEALALPTQEAVQVALRAQQVLAHETRGAGGIDPPA